MKTSRVLLAVLSAALVMPSCFHAKAFSDAWQTKSAEAYNYGLEKDFQSALQCYKQALALLPSDTPVPVKIDLELAIMHCLTNLGRLAQAGETAARIAPQLKAYDDSLLAVRYHRRCRELAKKSGKVSAAADHQNKVVDGLSKLLGESSADTLDEIGLQLALLREANRWTEAVQVARKLEKTFELPLRSEARNYYRKVLNWFFSFFGSKIKKDFDRGDFALVSGEIDELTAFKTDPAARLKVLNDAVTLHLTERVPQKLRLQVPESALAIIDTIPENEKTANHLQQEAISLLSRGLTQIDERNARAAIVSLRRAVSVTQSIKTSQPLPENLLYVQCQSSLARAIALDGDTAKAELMLRELRPNYPKFRNISDMYGILQARRDMAGVYKSRGQMQDAARQFKEIFLVLAAMSHSPRLSWEYKMWKGQEAKYLGRATP